MPNTSQRLSSHHFKTLFESLLPAQCLSCEQLCGRPDWLCIACEAATELNCQPCFRCAIPVTTPGLCADCAANSDTNHTPISSIRSPLVYTGMVRDLIQRWKFQGARELTSLLLKLSGTRGALELPHSIDAIVPMPMHWSGQLRRGYNQAELLASALAAQCIPSAPVLPALSAHWRGSSQHRLGRQRRGKNAQNRFRTSRNVVGKNLLLVDDVLTTGATSRAAASALQASGARHVHLWCLARSP